MQKNIIDKKPSARYKVVSYFACRTKRLKAYQNPKNLDNELKRINKHGEPIDNFKKGTKFGDSKVCYMGGLYTYTLNGAGKNTIVYLHGGGFINRPTKHHVKFALNIAKATNSKIYMPYYPLAPFSDVTASLEALKEFLDFIKEDFVLLGDSAGGGLIFSLLHYLEQNNLGKNVLALAAVSPWLDMRIEKSEKQVDRMMSKSVVKQISHLWRGKLKLNHPYCSPVLADYNSLKALIIVGGKEALLEDTDQLIKLQKTADLTVYNFVNLDHDFTIFPAPEALEAQKILIDYINDSFGNNGR